MIWGSFVEGLVMQVNVRLARGVGDSWYRDSFVSVRGD